MNNKWKKLGDFLELQRGTTYKGALLNQNNIGPVLLGLASIARNGGFRSDNLKNYSGESPDKLKLFPGDLFVSLKDVTQAGDLLGSVARVPKEIEVGRLTQDTVGLIFKNQDLKKEYLYWILRTPQYRGYCRLRATGTTNLGLSRIDFLSFPIPPYNSKREYLTKTLESLEDKIFLNRQMNQTLEAMAQALFKSWFVDFDPVLDNALESGHEIPDEMQAMAEKRQLVPDSKKLLRTNPALAAQFPSAFFFNEVLDKWVPEGWGVKTIDEISTVIGGGTPSTKIGEYFCENGIPWLSPKDLSGYEWKYISKGATDITPLGLKNSSAKLIPKGSVLFSSRAPIGYIAIAENEICTNQGFKSLIPDKGVSTEYLFQLLKSNADKIESVATGSTFKEVSGSALKGIDVLIPNIQILDQFTKTLFASNERALLVQKETETLTKLRYTLLPELISGRVRVPEGMIIH